MNEFKNPFDLLTTAYSAAEKEAGTDRVVIAEHALPTDQLDAFEAKLTNIRREIPADFTEWLSQSDIESVVQQEKTDAYQRFFSYLENRQIHPSYIEELKHVIPASDIMIQVQDVRFASNTTEKQVEFKGKLVDDPTRREITISMGSMYNRFNQFKNVPIFQDVEPLRLLKITIDSLMYHELWHCVQQAFRNHNGALREGMLGYVLTGPQLHEHGSHRFEHSAGSANIDEMLEAERQAEGVANDFLLSDLGFDQGSTPQLNTEYSQAQHWLRRKGFEGESVTDDPLFIKLRNVVRAIVTHGSEYSYNDISMALRQKIVQYPNIRAALEQTNVGYLRGVYFPAKREALKPLYNRLSEPPQNASAARLNEVQ